MQVVDFKFKNKLIIPFSHCCYLPMNRKVPISRPGSTNSAYE